MTKVKQQAEQEIEYNGLPTKVTGTIQLQCSNITWITGEKYDTCVCDLNGNDKNEINDAFEVVVKAYLKDRASMHTFELSGSTEQTFDGYIINFSPYRVSLIRHK
ncbi:hypothetical protein LZG74_16920 [Dyadobacter sp. CY327]|uniref:hypothetical protein n=1 Tax=Dyadobacter sp. CY327 TaxID=2907301 RepID=UPI001F44E557|nr:hypothetical protein [Dyadobacter sp. CY327]MCE7072001.1 hypothetical protein [Dyadobacter sp. CY327]